MLNVFSLWFWLLIRKNRKGFLKKQIRLKDFHWNATSMKYWTGINQISPCETRFYESLTAFRCWMGLRWNQLDNRKLNLTVFIGLNYRRISSGTVPGPYNNGTLQQVDLLHESDEDDVFFFVSKWFLLCFAVLWPFLFCFSAQLSSPMASNLFFCRAWSLFQCVYTKGQLLVNVFVFDFMRISVVEM